MPLPESLQNLVSDYREGFSLQREWYRSEAVFEREYEAIISRQWIVVGHVSQLPALGDYFVCEIAGESVIVVNEGGGAIRGLFNVCRHRGSRVCDQEAGHARSFVCPYHAWSYGLDGSLRHWRHVDPALCKEDFGLRRCHVRLYEGLIFLCLSEGIPPDFDRLSVRLRDSVRPYVLANTRVAARRVYEIAANWKLCVENNLECYHCLPRHPQYTAHHGFVKVDEGVGGPEAAAHETFVARWRERMQAAGRFHGRIDIEEVEGQLSRAWCLPLKEGVLTGSEGGQPVAPLLGSLREYDSSATSNAFGFFSYVLMMSDYALLVSYIPVSVHKTRVTLTWLVRDTAPELSEEQVERLTWLWDVTTRQDKDIIQLNAAGVASRAYRPGPYSELEWMARDFVARYLRRMGEG